MEQWIWKSVQTVIDITVTAENRTEMKHYQRVTVTRAAVVASTDATLSALTVDSSDSGDPEAFMDLAEKFAHSLDTAVADVLMTRTTLTLTLLSGSTGYCCCRDRI